MSMTTLDSIQQRPQPFQPETAETEAEQGQLALVSPGSEHPAGDGLAMMLLMMERAAQHSMANAQVRIQDTRGSLKEELENFLEQIAEAIRAAEKAREDDGGWFSDLLGSVAEIVGKVLGPILEHGIEIVKFQGEALISVGRSIATNQSVLDGLKEVTFALAEPGQISEDIQGFSDGVARFAADLAEFVGKLHVAVAHAALTGEDLGGLIEADAKQLASSVERNILDNPHFWAVTRAVGVGASVVALVATGGAVAPLVAGVALTALSELDKQTGFIEDAVGEKAANWVRLGIQVGAGACLALAGGSPDQVVNLLRTITGALEGARGVYTGVRTLVEGNRQADEMDRAAEQLATLQGMQRLQMLLEHLVDALEEDSEDHTRTRELGADLVATESATEAALIVPA